VPQTPVYQPSTPPVPTYIPPTPAPQTPVYQPPTYTPPAPVTPPPAPVYTPPTTQTPPSAPQPQVFYVPSNQQPTVEAEKEPETYYVPPVTQEPTIQSKPKVTIVAATPNHEPPPQSKPHPQKQYYVPSHPEAEKTLQDAASQPTIPNPAGTFASQPTIEDAPIVEAQTVIPNQAVKPWGTLTFSSNAQSVLLAGERAVVGRYDHDLGGIEPEVDLSKTEGSDTVSRIHAAFERNGSTYTLTDLNSTNATRINGKRLTPDTPTTIQDGDTLQFGKITCTFKAS
jgi:hypothetical protein